MLTLFDPIAYQRAFGEGAILLLRHRRLIAGMAHREFRQRYSSQIFGSLWAIGHPLFLTLLYIFIFAVVFKTRLDPTHPLSGDYTLYLLSGLIPWLAFQGSMSASTGAIVSNASMVKQFVFHIEVLPAKDVIVSMSIWAVGMTVILVYQFIKFGSIPLTALFLPLLGGLQVLAMIGAAFLLSAVTVFFRDLRELLVLFTTAGPFLMPIVYLPDWVPPVLRPILWLNPFSYMAWVYQDALCFGRIEHPAAWAAYPCLCLAIFAFGFRVFRRLKPMFASVL